MRRAATTAALLLTAAVALADTPPLYVTGPASALVDQGLARSLPAGAAAEGFQEVPRPGVRFVPNVARATNVPWIDSNGWRFQRGVRKANFATLPAGSAALAAAEAFVFNVEAILNPDPADVEELGRMLTFLKAHAQPQLPPMANIGVADDGSPQMGEVLNLLTRRNLLYRIVPPADRSFPVTVMLGTEDFPADSVRNPYEFAARVRAKLGDDNRLVRLYGTNTVIARLTGDSKRARLHLLQYGARNRRQQSAGLQAMRVRLFGRYKPTALAAYGADAKAALGDLRHVAYSTEFWVPDFTTLAIVDLEALDSVLESTLAPADFALNPDPASREWRDAPRVTAKYDKSGEDVAGPPTEIRSRWTKDSLYLLYICPYTQLNLKPDPNAKAETPRLWNWDVAEAFIGADFDNIARYREFQVSPQGEWVDLDIDRSDPGRQEGMRWNSGYTVAARIDEKARTWYGIMRIPFSALDARPPEKGRELRIGLYRIAGVEPAKAYYAWRPTGKATFHIPQAFGTLRLR